VYRRWMLRLVIGHEIMRQPISRLGSSVSQSVGFAFPRFPRLSQALAALVLSQALEPWQSMGPGLDCHTRCDDESDDAQAQ
jgi:hypothetical protein